MTISKKLAGLLVGLTMAGAAATPVAFAGGEPGDTGKCNSGRGNLSETTPLNDCDPGNSGGHNQGGD